MILPPEMNQTVLQAAYVVNDLREAAQKWSSIFGVGPFYLMEHIPVKSPKYRGQPNEVDFSTALTMAGGLQIELIQQHCDSPSCYRDMFAKGQEGFHHVAVICEDYNKEVNRYTAQGYELANEGLFGPMAFCYVDTSKDLSCMIELLEDTQHIRDFFESIRKGCENWDGRNPVRTAADL